MYKQLAKSEKKSCKTSEQVKKGKIIIEKIEKIAKRKDERYRTKFIEIATRL